MSESDEVKRLNDLLEHELVNSDSTELAAKIKKKLDQVSDDEWKSIMAQPTSKRATFKNEPVPREGTCFVCQGTVTEVFNLVPTCDPMHIPIGPGSTAYYRNASDGLHCTKCGIKYQFLPPVNNERKKSKI